MAGDPRSVALGMLGLNEMVAPILAAVTGYRKACEAAGFSTEASEVMAVAYHAMVMAQLAQQKQEGSS
jgi:Ca2+/H+ antiporter